MRRRVVVTGMGAVSPFGCGVLRMMAGLNEGQCALSFIPETQKIPGIDCHVAGMVPALAEARDIPREYRRTMSPMTIFACLAAREAIAQANFSQGLPARSGVSIGSTMGSGQELHSLFSSFIVSGTLDAVRTMAFFKIMAHTASAGVAALFGLSGRILNPVAACAAGLQGIGAAFEAIAFGREDRMLCGGTEEYSPLTCATFDKIGAASHGHDPEQASRPFDKRRDGIVCSEGAGILILEERGQALARGASILAEIAGYATVTSPASVASPDEQSSARCMEEALADAGADPGAVAYVNAHATATHAGDVAEGRAIERIWGNRVPVSSLKGHMGHAMAASGALETVACIEMMRSGRIVAGRNGLVPDPECGQLWHAEQGQTLDRGLVVKNSFALGGIYASLVLAPAE
ncbi:MAG: beta-ketoacyl-[acyl-carrier-protein] synthase family protein [Desulfovibrionaceae bacterium]|nr:beta-ketoacyl-[acyl-carrier-protein] synthase family protein [Desulfovibrionaceae bacterium]